VSNSKRSILANRDEARVSSSSRRIGLLVGLCSAIVIGASITVLAVVIISSARPERGPLPQPADPDHVVVDVDELLPWLLGVGIAAVLLLGLTAWLAARSSVRPLAEALRLQRSFVADASHELRTPLTALASRIQILERRLARGEPTEDVIAKLRGDTDAMSETLSELLTSAATQVGHGPDQHDGESSDPELGYAAAVDRLTPLAETRQIHLESVTQHAPGTKVALSQNLVARACIVLIDNAMNYSPPGGTITTRYSVTADRVEIRVEDQGPGIPAQEQSRIFERFARGAEIGNRQGFGLGLSLAKELAERGGGALVIERSSPQGSVFLLRLPRIE